MALNKLNRDDEAITLYNKSLAIEPSNLDILNNISYCLKESEKI